MKHLLACLAILAAFNVTAQVDGKGGGRADMAQGAAGSTENLAAALESVYEWVGNAS